MLKTVFLFLNAMIIAQDNKIWNFTSWKIYKKILLELKADFQMQMNYLYLKTETPQHVFLLILYRKFTLTYTYKHFYT